MKVKIEQELNEEFLSDVMITAFDGSYGACWYWACNNTSFTKKPKWDIDPNTGTWRSVTVYPDEIGMSVADLAGKKGARIDHGVLVTGIQRILDRDNVISPAIRDAIARGVLENDAGEIDAAAADCIVQAGWFGQVVFG